MVFADEEVRRGLVCRPVRFDPLTDTFELVGDGELEADGYGPKAEFKLTIQSDPPMSNTLVQEFRIVRGGVQRKTGNMWR